MTPARNNVRATRHFGIPARKSSPSKRVHPFPREKVRPSTASPWPNREKTRPARPKTPKSSHFSQAGRTFSRFPNQFTPQGELFRVSNAAPPSREIYLPQLHHSIPITGTPPPNTTPTGRKLSQQHPPQGATGTKLSQQHPPQGATGTKLSQQHPPRGSTGTKLSRHTQKQRKLAISREQGESFPVPNATPPSRENFLPQQHHPTPITGTPPPNHHPNRYKTLPTTPTSKPNRYKTLPTTPATRRNRYKTLPARPQSTKTGHFSPAGRIISRSQHRTTEQGEFSPATTPLNTHHRDTTTQHHPNR